MPAEDRHPHVHPCHQEEGGQPEARELHLSPVGDDVGQVRGDQGVDPAAGPGEVDLGVRDGDQEGARHHSTERELGINYFASYQVLASDRRISL